MSNAHDVFKMFSNILVTHKKPDCTLSADEIVCTCNKFGRLCVLWDGAFSIASRVDPSADDIKLYGRYVEAVVHSHVAMECSVTPKVHLMWRHVREQMCTIVGGLGQKREDWVEQLHQLTSRKRKQFRTVQNLQLRGESMASSTQEETNPEVIDYLKDVNNAALRGPREGYVRLEEHRRHKREESRLTALLEWEAENAAEVQCDGPVPEGEDHTAALATCAGSDGSLGVRLEGGSGRAGIHGCSPSHFCDDVSPASADDVRALGAGTDVEEPAPWAPVQVVTRAAVDGS